MYRWRLKLITPWGEPTRRRHGERDSTIDHAWVTATLPYRYWGDLGYEGSDHRAQLIEITTSLPARRQRAAEAPGWSWNLIDRDLVATEAKGLHLPPTSLDSPDRIDEAVDYLTAQLTHIADVSTPRRKASQGRGEPWWDTEVHDALHQTRSARRQYAASSTEPNWRSLQDACTKQLRTIKNAKTRSWRGALDDASRDTRQLWRLERWARLRSHLPPEPLSLPPLQGGTSESLATSHTDKASVLARRFFPHSDADLSDVHLNLQDDSY